MRRPYTHLHENIDAVVRPWNVFSTTRKKRRLRRFAHVKRTLFLASTKADNNGTPRPSLGRARGRKSQPHRSTRSKHALGAIAPPTLHDVITHSQIISNADCWILSDRCWLYARGPCITVPCTTERTHRSCYMRSSSGGRDWIRLSRIRFLKRIRMWFL